MQRLIDIHGERKSTHFSISLIVLAAAVSAVLFWFAGCSSDTGSGGSAPPVDTSSEPPPAKVAAAARGSQPVDKFEPPLETGAVPVPEGEGPELVPATEPGVGPAADSGVPRLKTDVVPTQPTVVLSAGHRTLCAVGVGDVMPPLMLTDIAGNDQSLAPFVGPKLTVVVFWKSEQPYAKEQFERLEREVVDPFGDYGVKAVTINVGDPAAAVQAASEPFEASFPVLLDADGAALATVGSAKLPRTYLLDPAGRILWFDIEYSESTRRELRNAIVWYLTHDPIVATRAAGVR